MLTVSHRMSAGDLGLDPSGIEESLNLVLDMVSKWNAVLLLDEADVVLEKRSFEDVKRNAIVSGRKSSAISESKMQQKYY